MGLRNFVMRANFSKDLKIIIDHSLGTGLGFTIPTEPIFAGEYDYYVNWGDGTSTGPHYGNVSKTYSTGGIKQITIKGRFKKFKFSTIVDKTGVTNKLVSVSNWGDMNWGPDQSNAFSGCSNLLSLASDVSWTSIITNMSFMFFNCSSLNSGMDSWNVSNVANMNSLFRGCSSFNQYLNSWDTGYVEDMSFMFAGCSSFDQNIDSWNTREVGDMSFMFAGSNFNSDLASWNIGNVSTMENMFFNSPFNQDISSWDVSSIDKLDYIFGETPFNQDISNWNPFNCSVTGMFSGNTVFNKNITGWDMSNKTNLDNMFNGATSFNQNISLWNVSSITSAIGFMRNATAFTLTNLNNVYNAWSSLSVNSNVAIEFSTKYSSVSKASKDYLTEVKDWNIIDRGINVTGTIYTGLPQNFESASVPNLPTGWLATSNGFGANWTSESNGTVVINGTKSAYVNRVDIGNGNTSENWLISPLTTVIDSIVDPQIRFMAKTTLPGNQGSFLQLRVSLNSTQSNLSSYKIVKEWSETELNPIYNSPEQSYISLPNKTLNRSIYVAFVRVHTQIGAGAGGDRFIVDDIFLDETCTIVSALSAINITKNNARLIFEAGIATNYQIGLILSSSTFNGTVTHTSIGSNKYVDVSALTQGTAYKFYTRANCGSGNFSPWIGPFNFTTLT